MLRRLSATPCPIPDAQSHQGRRDSTISVCNETATNLDYTTEFKALYRNAKPRRRPTAISKPNGAGVGFTIHEDEELKLDVEKSDGKASGSNVELPPRRRVVSQPPHRPKHRVSFANAPQNVAVENATSNPGPTFSNAPRRLSFQAGKSAMPFSVAADETLPPGRSPKISKPARRGTIYIPSDDTTMPSMYMGIFSPLKHPITEARQDEMSDMTGLAAQMAKKKTSRKSILAASPKRAPLFPHTKPLQVPNRPEDRLGRGPGKENLPPGHVMSHENSPVAKSRKSMPAVREAPQYDSSRQRPPSRLLDRTASSSAKLKDQDNAWKPTTRPAWNSRAKPSQTQPVIPKTARIPRKSLVPEQAHQQPHQTSCVPTRFAIPSLLKEPVLTQFPLLSEGVPDVSMYEESWLTQQEIAITQLVNSLFQASLPTFGQVQNHDLLRSELLELYGSQEMSLLYKRLQGALFYGPLSIAKEGLADGSRLQADLGYRRSYLNLWLETYDHQLLRTALEVVVGRMIRCNTDGGSRSGASSSPSTIDRGVLQQAIETFLVRNEDCKLDPTAMRAESWEFQRTVLRSLMLIKLLDLVKTKEALPPTSNLFQTDSRCKTSASVVQRLMQLMNPGMGDSIRHLSRLGYTVSHSQYPLEEYDYAIRNLSIDLRDGVRITRLVELLMYRSASQHLSHNQDADATTTLVIPTGEVLSLTDDLQDWPLSQHLKFPCLGRSTKVFNNQIALSALRGVKSMGALFDDIDADDIVDGYREKTVRLLWALTSKWGLGGLVDWDDVKTEIKRLGRVRGRVGDWNLYGLDFDEEDQGYMRYKTLLKSWVKAVAGAHGLVVRNFTTSFADGRVFESIVDEYEPCLVGFEGDAPKRRLANRLKHLGCSEQFVRLFETTPGHAKEHIFDRDFVLASLAFLCSRLLGPSKRARAAVAIQRGWRDHWSLVLKRRQAILRVVAECCAAKVQDEDRRRKAKVAMLRVWRAYKARKARDTLKLSTRDHCLAKPGSGLSLEDNSREDEDIWLSL